jgi:hypothetical protein
LGDFISLSNGHLRQPARKISVVSPCHDVLSDRLLPTGRFGIVTTIIFDDLQSILLDGELTTALRHDGFRRFGYGIADSRYALQALRAPRCPITHPSTDCNC